MKNSDSIRNRWLKKYLLLVVALLMVLELLILVWVNNYYKSGIKNNLINRASMTSIFLNKYLIEDTDSLYRAGRDMVYQFPAHDVVEMQVLDSNGNILVSSSLMTSPFTVNTPDFAGGIRGEISVWEGPNSGTRERIMAVSAPIIDSSGQIRGVIRYLTSMEYVLKNVLILFFTSLSIMMIFILFLVLSGAYFIRSIINPVQNIIKSANEIARGNWSVHIEKQHDDEIGLLADTMNAMAKDLQQADELKNEFISSVSHELRTPLTSIKGWSETALMTDVNDTQSIRKCLAVIAKESERLSNMVEQMLNFPKTKNAKLTLSLQEMDLQSELDDIIFIFMDRFKQDSLKIQYRIDEELPPIIGDRDKLKQVFINILDNAAKFSNPGGTITVASSFTKTTLTVSITDEGCGIPKEELPRVRDKFYKGISQKRGSGLGLAITDEIVTAHGGTLVIESEYGQGTCVRVTLPLKRL